MKYRIFVCDLTGERCDPKELSRRLCADAVNAYCAMEGIEMPGEGEKKGFIPEDIKEGEKGKITLDIRKEGKDVYLMIQDSGNGMSPEKIQEMNQSISQYDEKFGYGVRNVNKRIELMFGKEYGLHFSQNELGGLTVEIHLPLEGKTEDKGGHINV